MTSLPWWAGVLVVATCLLTVLVMRWLARLGGARGRSRGLASERRAKRILERAGYRIVQHGLDGRGHVCVDGRRVETALRADYLVERGGQRFVVEVKSGARRRPTIDTTRRQILEYCLAFDVAVVLLVDAHDERIMAVSFDYESLSAGA